MIKLTELQGSPPLNSPSIWAAKNQPYPRKRLPRVPQSTLFAPHFILIRFSASIAIGTRDKCTISRIAPASNSGWDSASRSVRAGRGGEGEESRTGTRSSRPLSLYTASRHCHGSESDQASLDSSGMDGIGATRPTGKQQTPRGMHTNASQQDERRGTWAPPKTPNGPQDVPRADPAAKPTTRYFWQFFDKTRSVRAPNRVLLSPAH